MKEYRICLTPLSSFEIPINSDTLFGAICWGIRTLFGEAKLVKVLQEFEKRPTFLISSAFPWKIIKEKRIWYLPKPILPPLKIADLSMMKGKLSKNLEPYHTEKYCNMDLANRYKHFRNLKWIPIESFKRVVKGGSEKDLFIDYLDGFIWDLHYAEFGITQKNSLDRLTISTTGAGETFYTNDICFRKNYGLYFLLKTADIDTYLRPVCKLLQDSGIGPNARTGKNWFTVKIEEEPLFDNKEEGNTFITLSRYIARDGIIGESSWYQLASVRSKVESRQEFAGEDIWKDRITYIEVGSVVKPKEQKEFYGSLVAVKEVAGKTVYQYGFAYPVWLGGKTHGI